MFEPKRKKYFKSFRGRMKGESIRGSSLVFGDYGLKALGRGWMTSQQLEAGRRAITYSLKKGGRMWIRVFPDKPVSARPAGQRMGSGKGEVKGYVSVVTPGRIIYEVAGISDILANEAFAKAAAKMPFKTKMIKKEDKI